MCTQNIPRVSWSIPQMASARLVFALLFGMFMPAWLQNECIHGYWVQFDADAPFRLVEEIEE